MDAFSQKDSLGSKNPNKIAEYLLSIGDEKAAARFKSAGTTGQGFMSGLLGNDPYAYMGILLGFVDPDAAGSVIAISDAPTIEPDLSLKGKRVKITLDKFYVQKFPGRGKHTVLCEFTGKNQISSGAEELRFALTTDVKDKSSAAVSGVPIFLGVSVGNDGIAFEGRTINVRSDTDEKLVDALGSDAFQQGLSLLTSAQPALKPFVGLAGSVVKSIMSRNKNRQVYCFKLGLDFDGGATSVRLRRGSYIVVQADKASWDWKHFVWNKSALSIVHKETGKPIELNYMVFGVSAVS